MPALNIHDAPKGTEARRAEPGTLGCKECIFYSSPDRCTKSSPRRCGAFAREDCGDVCFVEATGNPRVSLRTHSGVPTPPEWATKFVLHFRKDDGSYKRSTLTVSVDQVHDCLWNADRGFKYPVAAVEWLK